MPLSNRGWVILRLQVRFVKYHCVRNFLRADWASWAASSPLTIAETKRGESDFSRHSARNRLRHSMIMSRNPVVLVRCAGRFSCEGQFTSSLSFS